MIRRKFWIFASALWVMSLGLAPQALASSYLMTNGHIVDPIRSTLDGSIHPYDGPNLEPGVNASGSGLAMARLKRADLVDAVLSGSSFASANLRQADFSGADLSWTDLTDTIGHAFYSPTTLFDGAFERLCHGSAHCVDVPFDPAGAGWVMIPEPTTGLSLLLGLLGLSFSRRF